MAEGKDGEAVASDKSYYTSSKIGKSTKSRLFKPTVKKNETDDSVVDGIIQADKPLESRSYKSVLVNITDDHSGNLVQLKFHKNIRVPRVLLQLVTLIVDFHPYLTSITIDRGLDQGGMYELSKIIGKSKVTDVILDNTKIPQANYYILLDVKSFLNYLSLARCSLNDDAVEQIALKLPLSNLSILNFSSNSITDIGASHLGTALRLNRKLRYLNLAGNMITDKGADSILSTLTEFSLTVEELKEKKVRHMAYLKEVNDLAMRLLAENKLDEGDKKGVKKKTPTMPPMKSKKSSDSDDLGMMSFVKFQAAAKKILGTFTDPYREETTFIKSQIVYCTGNSTLSYLSLAYNYLTYFSVKKLYTVMRSQARVNRQREGLINVCIEGNNIPKSCEELTKIDQLIQNCLGNTRPATTRKKSFAKSARA